MSVMAPSGIPGDLQLYLALPNIGDLFGGLNISPDPAGSSLRIIQSLRRARQ